MALLFRNYIGPKSQTIDINFTDVPIYREVNFHFLLASARDYDKQNFLTNDTFYPYWNEHRFGPTQVNDIVGNYSNVKVFGSIGSHDDHFPFNPTDPKKWIESAVTSLGKLIDEYNLDGIDVCYSSVKGSKDDFAYWVGELINRLKDSYGGKFIASITLFHNVKDEYLALYQKYKQYIDYVGYQFYYEDDPTESVDEFHAQYTQISHFFPDTKLVAGFSSEKEEIKKLTTNVFFEGSQKLKAEQVFGGISIWSADDSKPEFENERKAQNLLQTIQAATPSLVLG